MILHWTCRWTRNSNWSVIEWNKSDNKRLKNWWHNVNEHQEGELFTFNWERRAVIQAAVLLCCAHLCWCSVCCESIAFSSRWMRFITWYCVYVWIWQFSECQTNCGNWRMNSELKPYNFRHEVNFMGSEECNKLKFYLIIRIPNNYNGNTMIQ